MLLDRTKTSVAPMRIGRRNRRATLTHKTNDVCIHCNSFKCQTIPYTIRFVRSVSNFGTPK